MICLDLFDDGGFFTLGCGHRLHLYCLVHSMATRSSCPLCSCEIPV
ncbi:RING finger domain-containing protein, partial [Escherichia coli]